MKAEGNLTMVSDAEVGVVRRFLSFYLMTDHPDQVRGVATQHSAYWDQQALAGYLGGPFADRSGGLITFEADTPALAENLVSGDPFLRQGCISSWWLKEWLAGNVGLPDSTAGDR
jgi:uncharacterized protein YciI